MSITIRRAIKEDCGQMMDLIHELAVYEKEPEARKAVVTALQQLNTLNGEVPNSMVLPFFFQGRTAELSRMFRKSPPDEKSLALDLLTRIDISNANTYKQELK